VRCRGWCATWCPTCHQPICHSCTLCAAAASLQSHNGCDVPLWKTECEDFVSDYLRDFTKGIQEPWVKVDFESTALGPHVRLTIPGINREGLAGPITMEMGFDGCLPQDDASGLQQETSGGYLVQAALHVSPSPPPLPLHRQKWRPPEDAGGWKLRDRKPVNYSFLDCPIQALLGGNARKRGR